MPRDDEVFLDLAPLFNCRCNFSFMADSYRFFSVQWIFILSPKNQDAGIQQPHPPEFMEDLIRSLYLGVSTSGVFFFPNQWIAFQSRSILIDRN